MNFPYNCFSEKLLNDKDRNFVIAERCNTEAMELFHNKNVNLALSKFDYAINHGSLNAINNKFSVLYLEKRFKESFDYLESIAHSSNATMLILYNLAVIYYIGDAEIKCDKRKNITEAYKLLIRADNLPQNANEVYREENRKEVKNFISRIEKDDNSLINIKQEIQKEEQKPP